METTKRNMLDDDLKDLVGSVKQRLHERHETFEKAKQIEQEDRQEFLRRYRKCAANEILPVLREVKEQGSELFRVKVNDYSSIASVELEIDLSGRHGRLVYRGDYERKIIVASFDKWSDKRSEYEPEELTRQTVNQHVRDFIAHLAKNLT